MGTFQEWIEGIEAHAQAAGAAITQPLGDPITDVTIGLPLPRGRCGRIYWGGEAAPGRVSQGGGRYSLNAELVAEQIVVTFYWPVSDATEATARSRVLEMREIAKQVRTRILGDATLGGKATDLVVDYAEPGLELISGTWYATVSIPILTDHTEYSIAE